MKNINTGYPAHEPLRITIWYIFAEVRGLDILYFCVSCCFFSRSFYVLLLLFVMLFCMFSPSLFKLLHLQSKKSHIKTFEYKKKTLKASRKTWKQKRKQKYIISQPEPERYLFAVGSRAGYPVLLLFYVVFFSKLCCFIFVFFSVLFVSYYRRKSLSIEGNALRITTNNSWKSLTIQGDVFLINEIFKKIVTIERKPFPYYRHQSLTI